MRKKLIQPWNYLDCTVLLWFEIVYVRVRMYHIQAWEKNWSNHETLDCTVLLWFEIVSIREQNIRWQNLALLGQKLPLGYRYKVKSVVLCAGARCRHYWIHVLSKLKAIITFELSLFSKLGKIIMLELGWGAMAMGIIAFQH